MQNFRLITDRTISHIFLRHSSINNQSLIKKGNINKLPYLGALYTHLNSINLIEGCIK